MKTDFIKKKDLSEGDFLRVYHYGDNFDPTIKIGLVVSTDSTGLITLYNGSEFRTYKRSKICGEKMNWLDRLMNFRACKRARKGFSVYNKRRDSNNRRNDMGNG